VLLLERLLAMDHKAIANNQKLRTQEYIQLDDLDAEVEAVSHFTQGTLAANGEGAVVSGSENGDTAVVPSATAVDSATIDLAAPSNGGNGAAECPSKATSLGNDPVVDVGLYQSFWGLQEALQHPEKLFERKDSWSSFHNGLSTLLKLFVKYPAQDSARQPWTQPEPAPLRHAPRARALAVQLDDPGFRLQFLTQVMIAFQALEQDGSSKRDAGGAISRQPDPVRSEFKALKGTCEDALRQTREGFPDLLKHVLDREAHWVTWKAAGCREFERESLEMLNARITPADMLAENLESSGSIKPRLQPHLSMLLKTLKNPNWRVQAEAASDNEEAIKAMRPHAMKSMCDSYLDRLIEEDKPENGIEEEYKAKKNKVFMWQCRRLFCQQYLRVYSQKDINAKTDFMDYVHGVKGKPIVSAAPADKAVVDKSAGDDAPGGTEGLAAAAAAASAAAAAAAAAVTITTTQAAPAELVTAAAPAEVVQDASSIATASGETAESSVAVAAPASTPAEPEAASAAADGAAAVRASSVASDAATIGAASNVAPADEAVAGGSSARVDADNAEPGEPPRKKAKK